MIIAILMAGGKGTRLESPIEKPLLKFKKKYLIDYVIENLKSSTKIEKIVIAVSPNTPKTKQYLEDSYSFVDLIDTSGEGFIEDLSFILKTFEKQSKEDILLFINADLPLISSKIINEVINTYLKSNKQALSVMVPIEVFKENNIAPSMNLDGLVPVGLNILLSNDIIQSEDKLILSNIELAININTLNDLDRLKEFIN
ncbi:MAG: NTP transferase domain-containing protein [Methanobrevibacter sp.]|jgi:adenosylcobinamide-phosphate guanylyltransferase|nr:NTP transferase domain-containing protein [Methanobrevibacter sp.]